MEFQTKCIHGGRKSYDKTGAIAVPIYQSATFAHPGVGRSTGYDYSRAQNPTREYLEQTIAELEEGTDAIAFSTGMAAVSALMELFSSGDHIVISDDLYGGTHRLFTHISEKNGLLFTRYDTMDDLRKSVTKATKAILIESPTNPMMNVTDILEAARFASEHGILVIADNTFPPQMNWKSKFIWGGALFLNLIGASPKPHAPAE